MPASRASERAAAWETIHSLARLEAAAARHALVHFNCLERSLVVWWLLRRRGIRAELRIGARKEQKSLEAHAWVEFDDQVINDPEGTHRKFSLFGSAIRPTEAEL